MFWYAIQEIIQKFLRDNRKLGLQKHKEKHVEIKYFVDNKECKISSSAQ